MYSSAHFHFWLWHGNIYNQACKKGKLSQPGEGYGRCSNSQQQPVQVLAEHCILSAPVLDTEEGLYAGFFDCSDACRGLTSRTPSRVHTCIMCLSLIARVSA